MEINKIKYDDTKKSIIITEGPQGVGKTGFAEYCRETIPFSNLYRLSGTSDKGLTGREKAKNMYYDLLDYLKKLENKDLNLLFDRTFFSEEAYCRMGYKDYQFSDVYFDLVQKLNDIDLNIFVIFLYLEDTNIYKERLQREKTKSFTQFTIDSSIEQQTTYLEMAKELESYNNINPILVPTDNFDTAYKKLHKLLPPLNSKIK